MLAADVTALEAALAAVSAADTTQEEHQPVELASFEALMKSVMSSKPTKKGAVMNNPAPESDTAAEPPAVQA